MKLFLHTTSKIRIINGDQEWQGTHAEFQAFEPEYPGLPVLSQAPAIARYQTPELKYIEDSNGARHPDLLIDCLSYCDNIGRYLVSLPTIYVSAVIAKALLCASEDDRIPFTVTLRAGPETDAAVLPISATWPIMLRQKNGLAMDNILIAFVDGVFSGNYTYNPSIPLGEWFIDEQDFAAVTYGGQTYQVKLSAPIRFTVYRNL